MTTTQILHFVLEGATFLLVIWVLFYKHYLPAYLAEKGKNLATREDVKHITQLIEGVKTENATKLELLKDEIAQQASHNSLFAEGRRKALLDFYEHCLEFVFSEVGSFPAGQAPLTSLHKPATELHTSLIEVVLKDAERFSAQCISTMTDFFRVLLYWDKKDPQIIQAAGIVAALVQDLFLKASSKHHDMKQVVFEMKEPKKLLPAMSDLRQLMVADKIKSGTRFWNIKRCSMMSCEHGLGLPTCPMCRPRYLDDTVASPE